MFKKIMSSAAVAVSIVGVSAAVAPAAMATANDGGTTTLNGNGASQAYGNSETHGDWSPQFALIQGSLNKPCIALLKAKANVGSLLGVVPISVQDINVLSSPQNQQCTENSTQAKGDEALSHLLNDIPILSGNGRKQQLTPGDSPGPHGLTHTGSAPSAVTATLLAVTAGPTFVVCGPLRTDSGRGIRLGRMP